MITNSALLDKSECRRRLQEVVDYLKRDTDTLKKSIDVLCDISDIMSVPVYVSSWRELVRFYQHVECLLSEALSFIAADDEMRSKTQKHIEAFQQARAASRPYLKAEILKQSGFTELLKLGFPCRTRQTT